MNPGNSGNREARSAWPRRALPAAALGALLIVAFWPILVSLFRSWFDEPANMEHGVLVVPAALCMVWTKRKQLAQVAPTCAPWGLILVFWGAAQAMIGIAAHWVWVSRSAFLVSLTGCIAALYGAQMVRAVAYPLATLLLMIAPPTFVYDRVTLQLQLLASRLGAGCLEALNYPVLREGNVLELVGVKLSVEQACSGLRSLVSILFLCVVYNYFFVRSQAIRVFILTMSVPIAIIGNAMRIVVTGIESQYHRQLTYGTAHETLGYISVAVSGAACVALHLVGLRVQKSWRSRQA